MIIIHIAVVAIIYIICSISEIGHSITNTFMMSKFEITNG